MWKLIRMVLAGDGMVAWGRNGRKEMNYLCYKYGLENDGMSWKQVEN